MTPTQSATALHNIKQAFEDFVAHDAERVIAEATRDRARDERLWVVLYDDGRYGTEHRHVLTGDRPAEVAGAGEHGAHVAFPVPTLAPDDLDEAHLEDSRFEGAIDALWQAYDTAIHEQL